MFRLITPSVDIVQHFLKQTFRTLSKNLITGLLSGLIYVGTCQLPTYISLNLLSYKPFQYYGTLEPDVFAEYTQNKGFQLEAAEK